MVARGHLGVVGGRNDAAGATVSATTTINRVAIANEIEACRSRDASRAHRLAGILAMLDEADLLRTKAGEVLMTLQPAEGPANRSGRSGGPMENTLAPNSDDTETLAVVAAYREAFLVAVAKLHEAHVEIERLMRRVRELHEERRAGAVESSLRSEDREQVGGKSHQHDHRAGRAA